MSSRTYILTAAKMCWRLVEDRRVLLPLKCRRFVEVRTVRLDYRHPCIDVVAVRSIHFGYQKACRMLVEIQRVGFNYRNTCRLRVGFVESV